MSDIYEDKIENKKYSGSGVFIDSSGEGAGVSSVNGKDGSVVITINNVDPTANVNIGIDGSSIPLSTVESVNDISQTIEDAYNELDDKITENISAINSLDTKVSANTAAITTMSGRVDSISDDVSGMQAEVEECTETVSECEDEVSNMSTQVSTNASHITDLETRMDEVTSDIRDLKTDVSTNAGKITELTTKVTANTTAIAAKKSVERLVVGQDPIDISNHEITIDLGSETTTGLTGEVDNASESEGDFSTIELTTADCVPKKFVVTNKDNEAQTVDVVSTSTSPYKFLSSDNTISITNTSNDGEIDLKVYDTPTDKNYTFTEALTTTVNKMIIGYEPTQNYFTNYNKKFDFTLKSTPDLFPKTTDLFLIVYYSDYMNRFPDKFKDYQGIFLLEGVPTDDPDGDLQEMLRIYSVGRITEEGTKKDLTIAVLGQNGHTFSYNLNDDLTPSQYTGSKIKINLSDHWRNTGYSLTKGSFHGYTQPTAIAPFDYSVVCGHMYFTFQYKE